MAAAAAFTYCSELAAAADVRANMFRIAQDNAQLHVYAAGVREEKPQS